MTVAEIITAARQYAQITGSVWFNPADELRSVNRSYRDVYEKILDANDEYFIKELTVLSSALATIRTRVHEYTTPADWYRLRNLIAVLPVGEYQFARMDPQDIMQNEGYRYFGANLRLIYGTDYTEFRIEYYPTPIIYTLTTEDIVYPPQLDPLIIAYQMAMDIAKAGGADPTKHAEEYSRIWQRFEHAIKRRDNLRYTKVANKYRSCPAGW